MRGLKGEVLAERAGESRAESDITCDLETSYIMCAPYVPRVDKNLGENENIQTIC